MTAAGTCGVWARGCPRASGVGTAERIARARGHGERVGASSRAGGMAKRAPLTTPVAFFGAMRLCEGCLSTDVLFCEW